MHIELPTSAVDGRVQCLSLLDLNFEPEVFMSPRHHHVTRRSFCLIIIVASSHLESLHARFSSSPARLGCSSNVAENPNESEPRTLGYEIQLNAHIGCDGF